MNIFIYFGVKTERHCYIGWFWQSSPNICVEITKYFEEIKNSLKS